MKKRLRGLLFATTLIGAGLSALTAFAADIAPGQVLRVANQKGGTKALLEAAHQLDNLPYKIEWSEFAAAAPLLEAMNAGAVDTGQTGDIPFIFAYSAGLQAKAVQALQGIGGGKTLAIIVPPESPVHSFKDLKDGSVAATRGSIGHFLVLKLLEKNGMKPDDVKMVFLNPGDAKFALASNSIQGWAIWEPYIALSQIQDNYRVVANAEGVASLYGFQVASDAAIKDKRPLLEDFLTRLRTAQAWARENADSYAATWSKETGMPLAVAQKAMKLMQYGPVPMDETLQKAEAETIKVFYDSGVISKIPDVKGAFDRSFEAK